MSFPAPSLQSRIDATHRMRTPPVGLVTKIGQHVSMEMNASHIDPRRAQSSHGGHGNLHYYATSWDNHKRAHRYNPRADGHSRVDAVRHTLASGYEEVAGGLRAFATSAEHTNAANTVRRYARGASRTVRSELDHAPSMAHNAIETSHRLIAQTDRFAKRKTQVFFSDADKMFETFDHGKLDVHSIQKKLRDVRVTPPDFVPTTKQFMATVGGWLK